MSEDQLFQSPSDPATAPAAGDVLKPKPYVPPARRRALLEVAEKMKCGGDDQPAAGDELTEKPPRYCLPIGGALLAAAATVAVKFRRSSAGVLPKKVTVIPAKLRPRKSDDVDAALAATPTLYDHYYAGPSFLYSSPDPSSLPFPSKLLQAKSKKKPDADAATCHPPNEVPEPLDADLSS